LKNLPLQYRAGNLIFLGDFNLPQSHTVFNPLRKKGWVPAFTAQKTSLRQKCIDGDCLASEYDNIWYESARMKVKSARAIHFYKTFKELKSARRISDHIPIEVVLEFR
jgi:deoxyribonuclease-1-like protein